MFGAIPAATTLEAIAAQSDPVCNLDVAGFKSAPVCIVFETLAGIARVIANGLVFADDKVDSTHIDNTFACVKSLNADNEAIQGDLEDVKNDLATVEVRVVECRAGQTGIGLRNNWCPPWSCSTCRRKKETASLASKELEAGHELSARRQLMLWLRAGGPGVQGVGELLAGRQLSRYLTSACAVP